MRKMCIFVKTLKLKDLIGTETGTVLPQIHASAWKWANSKTQETKLTFKGDLLFLALCTK